MLRFGPPLVAVIRVIKRDSPLEQRVRRDLAFRFDQYGATVDSNTLEAYGNSEVSVGVGNLEFQFERMNGTANTAL